MRHCGAGCCIIGTTSTGPCQAALAAYTGRTGRVRVGWRSAGGDTLPFVCGVLHDGSCRPLRRPESLRHFLWGVAVRDDARAVQELEYALDRTLAGLRAGKLNYGHVATSKVWKAAHTNAMKAAIITRLIVALRSIAHVLRVM